MPAGKERAVHHSRLCCENVLSLSLYCSVLLSHRFLEACHPFAFGKLAFCHFFAISSKRPPCRPHYASLINPLAPETFLPSVSLPLASPSAARRWCSGRRLSFGTCAGSGR